MRLMPSTLDFPALVVGDNAPAFTPSRTKHQAPVIFGAVAIDGVIHHVLSVPYNVPHPLAARSRRLDLALVHAG